jgi:hypothetical protein
MEEKNVAVLASLLKKSSDDVTKALETEDGLQSLVSDFTTNNQVFNIDEFVKLKSNLKKETIDKLEEVDIPESFKAKSVGWKLEKLENEVKEKYQFTDEFKGLTDLIDKVVTKSRIPNNGDVDSLKNRIVELESEYKDKLTTQQKTFDGSLLLADFGDAIKAIGLDYDGDVLKKQKGLVKAAFNDMFSIQRQDGKTVVLKGEDVIKDKKFDPLPLKDVMLEMAKDYGFQLKSPDQGGHGGGSSKKKAGLKGVTWVEYLENNNVSPNTDAADILYSEWKEASLK